MGRPFSLRRPVAVKDPGRAVGCAKFLMLIVVLLIHQFERDGHQYEDVKVPHQFAVVSR
jgi:hypothetical protein